MQTKQRFIVLLLAGGLPLSSPSTFAQGPAPGAATAAAASASASPTASANTPASTQPVEPTSAADAEARTREARSPAAAFLADRGRISYSVGMEMARNFKKNEFNVDIDRLVKGLQDGLAGTRPEMGEKEFKRVLNDFQNLMRAHTMASTHLLSMANRKRGESFFASNKSAPGVQVLSNGVQYKVLKPGEGKRPTERDIVEVNWRGTNLDGEEFDSSQPGTPMRIPVADMVNGWRSAMVQMSVGAHWLIWVPAHLAYGDRGVGTTVGPNETLLFDVELAGVRQPGPATP